MNNGYMSQDEANVLDNLMPGNQNIGVGAKLKNALASGVQFPGTKWYLDPAAGSDDNDGLSAQTAFKTLPYAYAKLTANKNEILYLIGGTSSINLSAAFTWAKAYTHLVGVCPDMKFGGRARIGHSADFTSMFTINAAGCLFKNIHWQFGRGSTTNVNGVVVSATSHYCSFDGCHFEGALHATESGGSQAWRMLVLQGDVSTGVRSLTFRNCTFGTWTVVWASAAGTLVEFQGIHAGTHFVGCDFVVNSSSTAMLPVKSDVNLGGAYAYITFQDCRFIAVNATTAAVFGVPTMGKILIDSNCSLYNCTAWSASAGGNVLVAAPVGSKVGGFGVSPT